MERALDTTITIRVPADLMVRIKAIADRDYAGDSATLRRLLRLGLEADERRERVDGPRSAIEVA